MDEVNSAFYHSNCIALTILSLGIEKYLQKKQIEALKVEIQKEKVLFERPWLLEKLGEMY